MHRHSFDFSTRAYSFIFIISLAVALFIIHYPCSRLYDDRPLDAARARLLLAAFFAGFGADVGVVVEDDILASTPLGVTIFFDGVDFFLGVTVLLLPFVTSDSEVVDVTLGMPFELPVYPVDAVDGLPAVLGVYLPPFGELGSRSVRFRLP